MRLKIYFGFWPKIILKNSKINQIEVVGPKFLNMLYDKNVNDQIYGEYGDEYGDQYSLDGEDMAGGIDLDERTIEPTNVDDFGIGHDIEEEYLDKFATGNLCGNLCESTTTTRNHRKTPPPYTSSRNK